jgi:toxin FitB
VIVLDSSGWLEYFGEGPHAEEFATRLRQPARILTPTVAIYEVYKWIKRERSEDDALYAAATMRKTQVVPLTDEIALTAADLSLAHKLPMADAIMLATARCHEAELLTTDSDFEGIPGVTIFSKKPRSG